MKKAVISGPALLPNSSLLASALSRESGIHIRDRVKIIAEHFGENEENVWIACVWRGIDSEVERLRLEAVYKSVRKVAGIDDSEGMYRGFGFDNNQRLVSVDGEAVEEISLKASVALFRKLEWKFCTVRGLNWVEDDGAKRYWLRLIEEALK